MIRSAVVVVVPCLLLVACGDQASLGTDDPGAGPATGIGGEYVGTGPPPLFPDGSEPIRLRLQDGEIAFSSACNQFSGPATWTDGVLRTGAIAGTEMGCPGNLHEQDEWLIELFGSAPKLELDGTDLAVRAGRSEVWFVPADEVAGGEAGDADDLVDTTWTLTGIGEYDDDAGSMASIPEDVESIIRFEDELRLRTRDGRHELVHQR